MSQLSLYIYGNASFQIQLKLLFAYMYNQARFVR
jgi:hypothetical protein